MTHLIPGSNVTYRVAAVVDLLPPWHDEVNGKPVVFESKPLADSLLGLIKATQIEIASAPLNKLVELFPKVFGTSLRDVVGSELADDIDALGSVRNIITHGRNLIIDFPDDELAAALMVGSIDGNPMQKPLSRLRRAGIISSTKITGRNHDEVFDSVFSEAALRYFHYCIREAEAKLVAALKFPPCPEAMAPDMLEPLPD